MAIGAGNGGVPSLRQIQLSGQKPFSHPFQPVITLVLKITTMQYDRYLVAGYLAVGGQQSTSHHSEEMQKKETEEGNTSKRNEEDKVRELQ